MARLLYFNDLKGVSKFARRFLRTSHIHLRQGFGGQGESGVFHKEHSKLCVEN